MRRTAVKAPPDPGARAPATVVECCLNCGFGKSVLGSTERSCTCPDGPKVGKLVSPRFRCGSYKRWRPGFHTPGAKRGSALGRYGVTEDD